MKLFFSIFAFGVIFGAYLFPMLPDTVASHWDSSWEPDSFLPKNTAAFFIPGLMLFLGLILYNLPRIDPRIRKFALYYEMFIILLMLFLTLFHTQLLLAAIELAVPMHIVVSMCAGILMIFSGYMLGKSKRNWFVGVRTPWSLSSDEVWDNTHWLASKMLVVSGAVALLGVFYPAGTIYLIAVPLFLTIAGAVAYSYYEHRKLVRS